MQTWMKKAAEDCTDKEYELLKRLLEQSTTQDNHMSKQSGAQRKRDHDQRQRDMGRKLAQWWVTPEEKVALFLKLLELRRRKDND